jgi:hypothetical protein
MADAYSVPKEKRMRLTHASAFALAAALLVPAVQVAGYQDADQKVAGGGITAPGWKGKVDAKSAQEGMAITDSKFAQEGNAIHITTGPAASYWNPANMAKGDYTVKATFREPKQTYRHPHPYGLFIGGSKLETDQPNMLYCIAYRNGTFLVRQFANGAVNNVVQRAPNPAVHKVEAQDAEITQEIAWNVKGGNAECVINGTVVASLKKADIVGPGKLESTDGIAGIRAAHNSDVYVTGFSVTK